MLARKNKSRGPLPAVLAVVFTVGLILGAMSLFYIPEEVVNEARDAFGTGIVMNKTFREMYKNNFAMEVVWIVSIWILGSVSFSAPFSGAVLSVRGFFVGFSSAFLLTGEGSGMKFMACYILPQCLVAFPVMTMFTMQCLKDAVERKYNDKANVKYFVRGAIFVGITVVTAFTETWLTRLFISYL